MDQHMTNTNWDSAVDQHWGSCSCGWSGDMTNEFTVAHEACLSHMTERAIASAVRSEFQDWHTAMWLLAKAVAQFALEQPDTILPPKIQSALDRLAECDNPEIQE